MKRTLIIAALVLIISTSIIAGTLSMYTIRIDDLAKGDVVAKEFVFVGEDEDSFEEGVKIAPTEEVNWHFRVSNYEGNVITETVLYYRLRFHVHATEDKNAIEPLKITVNDEEFQTTNGEGTFDVFGVFELDEQGQYEDYYVNICWPDGDDDISYAGRGFGTTISVDALASQGPIDDQEPVDPPGPGEDNEPGDPQNPGEGDDDEPNENEPGENEQDPIESDIYVLYVAGTYYGAGNFNSEITITNNSEEELSNGWEISFQLPDDEIINLWEPNYTLSYDEETGFYTIQSPDNNTGYTIPKGGHKTISAKGRALNYETGNKPGPMKNVTVNGMPVELE